MEQAAIGPGNRSSSQGTADLRFLHSRYHLPLILGIALIARAVVFHADLIVFGWRPTDMASIAMNYLRNGFHFLYPQIYWGGNGPGYVETEFPIIPFIIACLYKVFGIHDWLAGIISWLSGFGLVVVVYLFTRYVYDPTVGLIAGVFCAVSPYMVELSTQLWPDPPMIFFGALGLYLLARWAERGTWRDYMWGACATTLAILLKLTALYLGIPILFLCVMRYHSDFWKKPVVWLLAILILVPPCLWYLHAYNLYLEYHNTFGILSAGYSKFAHANLLLSTDFYAKTFERLAVYHFTPVIFVLFIYGILRLPRGNVLRYVFHAWLAGVVMYIFVAGQGVYIGHYQYLLPIVPPGAALAGFGTVSLLRKLDPMAGGWRWGRGALYIMLTAVFLAGLVAANLLTQSPAIYTTTVWTHDKRTGLAVANITPPGSLIIVVDTQMDGVPPELSMTPPNVFYFSDRRGWYVSLSWLSPELIEQRRNQGATYLVITGNTVPSFGVLNLRSRNYLAEHYVPVMENEDGVVYDLKSRKGSQGLTGGGM